MVRLCKCGCGQEITSIQKETIYLPGHNYRGHTHSEEIRKKMSIKVQASLTPERRKQIGDFFRGKPAKNKGKPVPDEVRRRISDTHKLRMTPERIEKIRQSSTGRRHTEETKKKLSELLRGNTNNTGKPKSAEAIENWRKTRAKTGYTHPPDVVRRIVEKANITRSAQRKLGLGRFSEENKQKERERMLGNQYTKGYKHTEAAKCKLRDIARQQIITPEQRELMLENMRKRVQDPEYRKLHSGPNSSNWKGGTSFEGYCFLWVDDFKDEIRERDQFTCQNPECLIHQDQLSKKLHVHHIDYDKKNCHPGNLVSLCPKCHGKTIHPKWNDHYREAYQLRLFRTQGWLYIGSKKRYIKIKEVYNR